MGALGVGWGVKGGIGIDIMNLGNNKGKVAVKV